MIYPQIRCTSTNWQISSLINDKMKEVSNDTVATLCRQLPLILEHLDKEAMRNNLRLINAVRITRHQILPKLKKINKHD